MLPSFAFCVIYSLIVLSRLSDFLFRDTTYELFYGQFYNHHVPRLQRANLNLIASTVYCLHCYG